MPKPRTVLIDGSSLVYRAFFALPASLRAPSGLPTNAIYGFARMFDQILGGRMPQAGAVVFDAPGPSFREALYPEYKADRPSMPSELRRQLPWIERLVQAHRFPRISMEGVEADDVIGTLTRDAVRAGHEVSIVSIDKDFTQLISDDVSLVDTMRGVTYDPAVATRKWGVPPSQFVDLVALIGDKLDNIPGVAGIGKKGAVELLRRFGSLEGMLEHLDELPSRARKALEEQADLARLCKRLATIKQDVELPKEARFESLSLQEPDRDALDELYRELAFYSLLSKEGRARAQSIEREISIEPSAEVLERALASDRPVALVVLTRDPGTFREPIFGLALAWEEGAMYLSWPPKTDALRRVLVEWLGDPKRPKIIHDARRAWTALGRDGVELEGVVGDPGLASFLIDPAKNMPHRLDQVAREVLARPLPPLDLQRPGKEFPTHAVTHAVASLEAWHEQEPELDRLELRRLYEDVDLPISWVLGAMQKVGIRVDRDDLVAMGQEFARRKADVEAEIHALAGRTFNIDSPKQLSAVLFEELALPVIKRTKTGYSTAADVLERLAADHPIARLILCQRSLAKLISTYTNVLVDAVDPSDGRIHASFEQTVGVSGRIISTDPDLQRTPIRTEDGKRIRRAFIADPGWTLVCADWSQIDLRVLAHFSGDERLRSVFARGDDVHAQTASRIYDVPEDEVTWHQRRVGKTVNYATIYGQGATALSQLLGVARAEAVSLTERYFSIYEGVRAWREETIARAHRDGGVRTLLGRRRLIPELSSRDATERAHGERIALNTPIQGTAADLCKLAMLKIDEQLRARGLASRMLMQIHDELVLESPPNEVDEVRALVEDAMEHPYPLDVPLVVDVGVGASWADAH